MKKIFTLFLLFYSMLSSGQTFTIDLIDIIKGPGTFNVGCIVYKPAGFDATKKYPLVIFSHGMGEQGLNLNLLYNAGLPQVLKNGYKPSMDFILIAPQRSSYSVPPAWLPSILDEAVKRWNIDTTRIYLTGISAGGWAAYGSQLNEDTILSKRIAAIVVMSAATQDINKNNFDWWKISKTPLWAIVGESDVSYRDQNIFMVNSINSKVPNLASITIRPGIGHSGWNDVYNGTVKLNGLNIWEWLYQFKRGSLVEPGPGPLTPPVVSFGFNVGDIVTFKVISINPVDSTAVWQRIK